MLHAAVSLLNPLASATKHKGPKFGTTIRRLLANQAGSYWVLGKVRLNCIALRLVHRYGG